jgi:hypothetical protein
VKSVSEKYHPDYINMLALINLVVISLLTSFQRYIEGEYIAFFALMSIAAFAVVILWSIRGVVFHSDSMIVYSPILPLKSIIPFDEIRGISYRVDYDNRNKDETKILVINYNRNKQIRILKYALLDVASLEKDLLSRFGFAVTHHLFL